MSQHPRPVGPPRFARALVALVTPDEDRAFVLDDLSEEYARLRSVSGAWAARSWYWHQTFAAIGPGLKRRFARSVVQSTPASKRSGWRPGLGADALYSVRRLRRAPVLVLVTVTSLGLGIGATTTVFSVANGLLFKVSGAIADPDGILAIYTVPQDDPVFGETSFPDFVTLDADVTSLDVAAAYRPGAVQFGDDSSERAVMVEVVTADFFTVLGVRPARGRLFSRDEVRPGQAEPVVVVGHDFWTRDLGGRDDVIGRDIRLDGRVFTVIGVAPRNLKGRLAEMKVAAWVPAGLPGGFYHATDQEIVDRADREYGVLARARPGYTIEQVEAELAVVSSRLYTEHGDEWEDDSGQQLLFRVVPGNPGALPPEVKLALGATAALVMAAAGLILLIACSNVAGLLLAQAHERRQEIAVRAALGAGRWRLGRMLLVESALLALGGCALGVLTARVAVMSVGVLALPLGVPIEFEFGLDIAALLFAIVTSAVACLVFGLLPALAGSRAQLVPALKTGRGSSGGGSLRLRRLLVVGQVTACLVLLGGAGLVLRSVTSSLDADLGFTPGQIAVVSKHLTFDAVSESEAMVVFEDLAARLRAHPDVREVALATSVERVFDDLSLADIRPENYDAGEEPLLVRFNAVTPGYVSLLQLDLMQGRDLTEGDQFGTERVALVNEAFAALYWPNQPVLGRTIRLVAKDGLGMAARDLNEQVVVVGLIRDPADVAGVVSSHAKVWVPLAQHPSTGVVIHAEARGAPESIVGLLREETGLTEVPLIAAQPLERLMSFPLAIPRAMGRVMRWGGVFALVLSFLGIYGVVSFTVTERSREMAIRKAIGARPDQVVGRVMRHGVVLAVWGIVLGLAIVVPAALLIQSEFAVVRPADPVAVGGAVAVILGAALLASGIPARRLARLDPMTVLRDE